MKKVYISVASLVVSTILILYLIYGFKSFAFDIPSMIFLFGVFIFTISYTVSSILTVFIKKASHYRLFGIVDIIVLFIITVASVYDLFNGPGDLGGIIGLILLITAVPAGLVILIINIILSRINKSKIVDANDGNI